MSRHFSSDNALPPAEDPRSNLSASLTRLVTRFPPNVLPTENGGGLYFGPLSLAYLFFRLQSTHPSLLISDKPLRHWCTAYLRQGLAAADHAPEPTPKKNGIISDSLVSVALAAIIADDEIAVLRLCSYSETLVESDAAPEWLYGLAGYLYLLRLVKSVFPHDSKLKREIQTAADETIDVLLQEIPRPWAFRGKVYIGAVHGAAGILTQIVLTSPNRAEELRKDLEDLLACQLDDGNWPSSQPGEKDSLVQFCHGAPGVVSSLLSLRPYFTDLQPEIDEAIARGRECILERGLLTKEPCLCHGITGNAFALPRKEFEGFLALTTETKIQKSQDEGVMARSHDPASLWCGEAGRAWAWAVADMVAGSEETELEVIGFNDI